jgi:predicted transcriptional regulator
MLGELESQVMEIVWTSGELSVRDVTAKLARPLAYTTVMTTLDRLHKKGLLTRRKVDRAYLYSPASSRAEWEQKRAGLFMAGFLAAPETSPQLLVSCLLTAVEEHDKALLDEMEKKIRARRRELKRGRKP